MDGHRARARFDDILVEALMSSQATGDPLDERRAGFLADLQFLTRHCEWCAAEPRACYEGAAIAIPPLPGPGHCASLTHVHSRR